MALKQTMQTFQIILLILNWVLILLYMDEFSLKYWREMCEQTCFVTQILKQTQERFSASLQYFYAAINQAEASSKSSKLLKVKHENVRDFPHLINEGIFRLEDFSKGWVFWTLFLCMNSDRRHQKDASFWIMLLSTWIKTVKGFSSELRTLIYVSLLPPLRIIVIT